MRSVGGTIELSAADLMGHLGCRHLTQLDLAVATGKEKAPKIWDPLLQLLWERGLAHERSYIEHLEAAGFKIVRIEGSGIESQQLKETYDAMRAGIPIIVQGALAHGRWRGRPDVLKRVERLSTLGAWSYEVIDTKLACETKSGTILQLCLYSDLLTRAQGTATERMYIVSPWSKFQPQVFRTDDYTAYYRLVRARLEDSIAEGSQVSTYPDPKKHCEICRWRLKCDADRRVDDHLCLVAGISKLQINELKSRSVTTTAALASMPLPLQWKPERGSAQTYERIREQARLQFEARTKDAPVYELLKPQPGFGLSRLPEPSPGDIFLDFEGDPFVGERGLEYLLGYVTIGESGGFAYTSLWSLSREAEKSNFEQFVDWVIERWRLHPALHIYHFAPYEPAALKRLMGRYASREEEIDRMLRAGLFVDLFAVVRHALRAGVESYSIKQLEQFYEFKRAVDLWDANRALASVQACLELGEPEGISPDEQAVVQAYNQDDCVSTQGLRSWLEGLRSTLIKGGEDIARPDPGNADPTEAISDWQKKIEELSGRLTADVPADIETRTNEQQAHWLLANVLDWHRRENKAVWWEYFRLSALSCDELIDEPCAISGLTFLESVGGTAKAPVHRYAFPIQDTDLRGGEDLRSCGGEKLGKLEEISFEGRTVDIKKRVDTAGEHPEGMFAHQIIETNVQANALVRIGEWAAQHGISGEGEYQASRDLLLRTPPTLAGDPMRRPEETALQAALRIAPKLRGVLPIQGPPGAGKTYIGARMICELVDKGARIGITANSHKVIRNLLDEVLKVADEKSLTLSAIQKVADPEDSKGRLVCTTKNSDVFDALGTSCQIAAGTAWLWARPEAAGTVDVMFVDEAAQMSLANSLAISHAGTSVVLLGDPRQLDQPMQGSHPEGTDVSALDHLLGGELTIHGERGLFLEETWRLHPDICRFTSEMFYESRLQPRPGLQNQRIISAGPLQGSGLRLLPVAHNGNQSSSPEEADRVRTLVRTLLETESEWVDISSKRKPLTINDVLIIAPYNAQVFELQERLPGARIGTVDKFQGQEAPIVIYSLATSTQADAPHGMEFLYSLNRLNVATSRARCLCVLVASPDVFEPECRTPRQIQLANAFCRYRELAEVLH
jgi:predicted RecB family nuclease